MAEELSRDVVKHVAKLARLDLSEDELGTYAHQLSAILDLANDVRGRDLSDVEPTVGAFSLVNVLRKDTPTPSLETEVVLNQAPQASDGRFRVPCILGEAP